MWNSIRFIFCAFMLGFMMNSYCQQMPPGDIPTPNASDLGRYGDIPVSFYTGRPNVTIPLFNINVKGVELPINLRYDTSGLLMNSIPGWTGHNWTLEAGGVITRTAFGPYDEYVPYRQSTVLPFYNYFSSYAQLANDMNNQETLKNHIESNRYDYQPDIFTFNFMGKTGRFFLGNNGQWKVQSDENIEVLFQISDETNFIRPFIANYPPQYNSKLQPKVIKGFTLRDANGYMYEFGGDNNSIDYTTPFFRQSEEETVESFHAISWYLTKVKDKYGNLLYELNYERGKFIAQFYNTAYSMYLLEHYRHSGLTTGNEFSDSNSTFPYNGVLNSPVYLHDIEAANGVYVEFSATDSPVSTEEMYPNLNVFRPFQDMSYNSNSLFYYLQTDDDNILPYQYSGNGNKYMSPLTSTRLKQLDKITVKTGRNGFDRKFIKLAYDYNQRTHLRDVKFYSFDERWYDRGYSLKYDSYSSLPANYLTNDIDHWGYYNNAGNTNPYGHKNANPISTQYGVLSEIVYPTGGKSVFNYEQNDYSAYMAEDRHTMIQSDGLAGGLRIKSITDYEDSLGQNMVRKRTYSYLNPQTQASSGELYALPRYSWVNWYAKTETSNAVSKQTMTRATSIIPLSNSFGSHIGYSYVEERELDGSYTRYHFKNISSAPDDRFIIDFSEHEPSPYDMFTERGFMRGKLLTTENYDNNNHLMRRISHGYRTDNIEKDSVLTANLAYKNYGASAAFSFFTGGIYKLLYPRYDVVTDTISVYDDYENAVTDIITYDKQDTDILVTKPYSHYSNIRTLLSETHKRNQEEYRTDYQYEYPQTQSSPSVFRRFSYYFDLSPYCTNEYYNNVFVTGNRRDYRFLGTDTIVPDAIVRINPDMSETQLVKYLTYTPKLSVKTYRERGASKTTLKWSANDIFVSVKFVGDVQVPDNIWFDENNPDLHSTGFGYNAWANNALSYLKTPNCIESFYDYDDQGRLIDIQDVWGNTLKRFKYHYVK